VKGISGLAARLGWSAYGKSASVHAARHDHRKAPCELCLGTPGTVADWPGARLEDLPAPVFVADRTGKLVRVNRALAEAAGRGAADVLGMGRLPVGDGATGDTWLECLSSPASREVPMDRGTHGAGWVRITVSRLRDKHGEVSGYVGFVEDITRARLDEERLRQSAADLEFALREQDRYSQELLTLVEQLTAAKATAEQATRVKSEFLAVMSHEIRTPLNGVIGMTGILAETPLSAAQRDCVETIQSCAESLLTIVNDILDFSKIEAGRLEMERIDFNLLTLAEQAVGLLSENAARKHLDLWLDVDFEVAGRATGDPVRLRQAILNLLGNGVKFTETGAVGLQVRAAPERPAGWVRFEISDTGPGIAPDVQTRLFRPFSQADRSTTRRFGGTGLGLAISRQLVELMGGEISLQSEVGRGSTFYFDLPLEARPLEAPPQQFCHQRVLLADSNVRHRTSLRRHLESFGVQVDECADGVLGARLLREAAALGKPYAVVFAEQDLPVLNGSRLAAIACEGGLGTAPACFLLSPYHRSLKESGADGQHVLRVLPRPTPRLDIEAVLSEVLMPSSGNNGNPISAASGSNAPERHGSLLLAEDNEVNQRVALLMLRKLGYRVDIARNGREALEMAGAIRYDAILMDCLMPEIDGFEATRMIREQENPERRHLIIAMTANVRPEDRQRCFAAGMDDFIPKPVRLHQLAEVLDRHMAKRMPASIEECPQGNGTEMHTESEAMTCIRELQGQFGAEITGELCLAFLASTSSLLAALRAHAEESDAVEAAKTLHTLKGSSASIGMREFAAACASAERRVKDGDLTRLNATFEDLERRFLHAKPHFEAVAPVSQ